MSLGQRLQDRRIGAGMGLRELARKADITPSYLSDIESDRRVPSEDVLRTLANLLHLDADELISRAGRVGELVEDYIKGEPAAGILFRKVAEGRLNKNAIEQLIKHTEKLTKNKEGYR
ncbi:helix-turn-helix transcriptional regulator [Sorangium sp. So ce834]|uniref:helix-turn-helix domain-containing protein n=1 Tax=Sorangium sp. So ce834 TaxID=3133321 RepID=UPI003F5E0949